MTEARLRGVLRVARVLVLALVALVVGCANRPPPPKNLPVPMQSTTVGPGDVFEVFVVGEKDLPKEYRVQPDGTVDFPYIDRLDVNGKEPQDIARLIKDQLEKKQILRDAQVSLIVKQYNSKRVTVIGQVSKPGSIPWTEGMKLVDAVSQSGWFTPLADSNHVILNRNGADHKTVTAVISVDAITDGAQQDIPLQAGDTIKVEQRTF
jgi:protein involved in polysaccharide export with SLBB domain